MKNDSEILDKFCSSLDVFLLQDVSLQTRELLVKFAQEAVKMSNPKKHIARKILHYYGLLEKEPRKEKYPRDRAEAVLANFSVGITGARPGDILFGRSGINKGAIIKIHHAPVYPQQKDLVYLMDYPDLWDAYLVKLGSIPFFAEMSINDRAEWVSRNGDPTEISIGEGEERIEMLQPGTGDFTEKLTEIQVEELMSGGYWSSSEIESMFPGKPGSKARKHTLILLRSMWSVSIDYSVVSVYNGLTIVLEPGNSRIVRSTIADNGEIVYLLDDITKKVELKDSRWVRPAGKSATQKIGIQVSTEHFPKSDTAITELIRELLPSALPEQITRIRSNMTQFTGAAYKSLLQKLIRFRAQQVEMMSGELFSSELVLLVTLGELYKYAGSFVPDIQRYVSGLESLTKRLAISILEDSFVSDPERVFSLMSGALLAQRVRTWLPHRALLKQWFITVLEAFQSNLAYKYDISGGIASKPFVLNVESTLYQNASAILDELRSFPGDLGLARNIASTNGVNTVQGPITLQEKMPFIHCVDQHWLPHIALFYEPTVVQKMQAPSATPFSKLFENLFKRVTGYNPRKSEIFSEQDPFVLETRRAQMLTLFAKQVPHVSRARSSKNSRKVTYTLDSGWLAAMVGAIEIKGTPTVLVTLDINEPTRLIVIRRPARDMTSSELSPEREAEAIEQARTLLSRGVALDKTNPPSEDFIGAKAILRGDEYFIQTRARGEIPWELARKLYATVNVLQNHGEPYEPVKALVYTSAGISPDAETELRDLLRATSANVLFRVLSYITHFRNTIELNRVSREGGGTHHAVVPEDVSAYQFLLQLSWIYSAALKPSEYNPGNFDIVVNALFWSIRDNIRAHVTSEISGKWTGIADRKQRILWKHQSDSVADMVKQHLAGARGNFLWLPVGLGKTAVVMTFLKWLSERGKLPQYIIYTLPESAIKSVLEEINAFGFSVQLLIPVKSGHRDFGKEVSVSQTCQTIKPFTVTLIEHDYLRRCEGELLAVAPEAIFIIDEVHKALNETKRTSVALEISRLAHQFIALTGTPVIDSNTFKLLWWLEQVVNFQVNERNFWVAANSMVAKRANTGILVDYTQVLAHFTPQEYKEYRSYVPPAIGGANRSPTSADWAAAGEVSYNACDRKMVEETLEFLADGRGVMLVAKDAAHQQRLARLLIVSGKLVRKDIFVLSAGDSIFLTDEAVREGKVPDYKVVIVPIRKAEGYTLTRLNAMVSSVYPSNNATREQIEGRINRIGQARKEVSYRIVHAGLLTRILQHHNDAKSLSLALQSLAAEIN